MTVPANTNALLLNSAAPAAYQISRSLRFNSADSAYLSRTPGSAGNRKTWTWSGWVKRTGLGTTGNLFSANGGSVSYFSGIRFETDNTLIVFDYSGGAFNYQLTTSQVFRDPSAWYHVLLAFDSTQSTSSNRIKLYINGSQVTTFSTANYPSLNYDGFVNTTNGHFIAASNSSGAFAEGFNGYLADIYLLDGTATTPSTFAETDAVTGQWVPKTPASISYGTNGFRLTFSDNSGTTSTTLGKDAAGSNNWTPNNFSVASGSGNDSLVDSPTSYGTDTGAGGEVRGNYATFNPLNVQIGAGSLSNGNLDLTGPSGSSAYNYAGGTFGIDTSTSTGWYFEFTQTTYGQFASIGLLDQSVSASALNNLYIIGHSFANQTAGISYSNGGSIGDYGTLTTGLTSWTSSGDVIGVAIKDNKIWFAKNNTWISGSPSAGTSPSITLASTKYVTPAAIGINSSVLSLNAGQRAFAYTAPSGFKALCDTNLTAPTIAKPADYFDVKLYSGNSGTQAISGLNFGPEFIWTKSRNNATNHLLVDAIRGGNKVLISDLPDSEYTGSYIQSFDTSGYTINSSSSGMNLSGYTYVAWAWDAASSNSTNTSGTITSTVRANATAGFSIVTWTAPNPVGGITSVGHGLSATPQFMIFKNRDLNNHWTVYHSSFSNLTRNYLKFSTESVFTRTSDLWGTINSTVFNVDQGFLANASEKCVAYCFAPVAGYSAFGSYTGNGSSDGPFVFTGHRSRWIMLKRTDATGGWVLIDTARSTYNLVVTYLYADLSNAESTFDVLDITSNGFKLRNTFAGWNASGGTYVFASFAENPFQYARAR